MGLGTDEFTGRRFGRYEVLCRLAVGGMAEIFLGFARTGPSGGGLVVLKRILAEQREDPEALQMLIDEARLTATLSHPNVARVLDLEAEGDEVLLVIEHIAGANLEELMSAQGGEPLPLGFTLATVRDAAQGLGHAHAHRDAAGTSRPIVHRDVAPRNVMVDFDGAGKMLDFGIARAAGSARRTQAGMVRGTTAYMSPEQAVGKDVDPRTDLFSLGIVFHELLTGQRLFRRPNIADEMAAVYEAPIPAPSDLNRRVPKALDAVALRALERRVDRRYQSATEFLRDLSLAAGSTTWPPRRCAELVRRQFTERQEDISRLRARLPRTEPEARTLVVPSDLARTQVGGPPLVGPRPQLPPELVTTDPFGEPVPRKPPDEKTRIIAAPKRAPTEAPAAAAKAAPAEKDETSGPAEKVERSDKVEKPASIVGLERVPAAARGAGVSRTVVLVLAAMALAVGGVAGAWLVAHRAGPDAQAAASLGRLTVETDRPATLALDGQLLGATPVSTWVPAGPHRLELTAEGGVSRSVEVEVVPGEETNVSLSVDETP